MGNSKFNISKEAKELIDSLKLILDINETPTIIKLALAKGIAFSNASEGNEKFNSKDQWLVPENIIRDKEYLLFKHLIINEHTKVISDIEINSYFAFYIEKGIRIIQMQIDNKTSFEDIRVAILI